MERRNVPKVEFKMAETILRTRALLGLPRRKAAFGTASIVCLGAEFVCEGEITEGQPPALQAYDVIRRSGCPDNRGKDARDLLIV